MQTPSCGASGTRWPRFLSGRSSTRSWRRSRARREGGGWGFWCTTESSTRRQGACTSRAATGVATSDRRERSPPRCHMAGRGPVDGEGTRHDGVARVGRFCASSLARRRAKRGAGKSDSFRSVGLGPRCLHSGRRAPAARRRHVRHNTVLCAHIGVRPPGPAVRIYAHSHPGTIYPGLMVAFRFSVALIFIRQLYVFDRPSAGWSHFDPRDTRITIRYR